MAPDPMLLGLPVTIDLGAFATGVLAVTISIIALVVTLRGNRIAHMATLVDIRQQWEALHADWSTVRAFYFGDDSYYSDANDKVRKQVKKKIAQWSLDPSDSTDDQRAEGISLRAVARFFAYVSDQIVRGNISVDEAYSVFGPDVARVRRTVLWIAGRQRFTGTQNSASISDEPQTNYGPDAYAGKHWNLMHDAMGETVFNDEQSAIVIFIELMWATMAKRGDHYAHLLLDRAERLAGPRVNHNHGEWAELMGDLRFVTAARGRRRRSPILRYRLSFARWVRPQALRRSRDGILIPVEPRLVRIRLRDLRVRRKAGPPFVALYKELPRPNTFATRSI